VAERFVYGFAVSTDALWRLVGSGLDADEVLGDVDEEFLDMFDEEFDAEPGRFARDVLAGDLDPELAYPYTRLVEPLLNGVGESVGEIHLADTYYLPNESFGRWNPVLAAVGLPVLARVWAAPNCAFPWPRGSAPPGDWPCVTEVSPAELATVAAELRGDWRSALAGLPDDLLTDSTPAEYVRAELAEGLDELADWVTRTVAPWESAQRCVARSGNSLILVMDGSQ
jgi:hypothetical protein